MARERKAQIRRGTVPPSGKEEREFLAKYRKIHYPRPSVTVDVVIFTIVDVDLKILLILREEHPFKGCLALPGGFVNVKDTPGDRGEDLDDAAARVLADETGLPRGSVFLEQLYTFGKADRDPRTRVITVAYYALLKPDLVPFVRAGKRVTETSWFSTTELSSLSLAFDHSQIIDMALRRIRGKLDYTSIAFELVPDAFTVLELRAVHEVIKGTSYDPGNFRRRFNRMLTDGVIERAPGKRLTASKPAHVYRFRKT